MSGFNKIPPLTEGYVSKGGQNTTSKITQRPPGPFLLNSSNAGNSNMTSKEQTISNSVCRFPQIGDIYVQNKAGIETKFIVDGFGYSALNGNLQIFYRPFYSLTENSPIFVRDLSEFLGYTSNNELRFVFKQNYI